MIAARFTPQEEQQVVEAYQAGEAIAEIARRYDCHAATVNRLLIKLGLREKKAGLPEGFGRFTEHRNEILAAYAAGEDHRVLAERFGGSRRAMERFLDRNGVERRKQYENTAGLLDGRDKEIIALYEGGMDSSEIAGLYGCNKGSILGLLKRNGVARKTGGSRGYSYDATAFDIIDTEAKAYLLGFLYADGCHHRKNNKITLTIHERDESVIVLLKQVSGYSGPTKRWSNQTNPNVASPMVSVDLCNKQLSDAFIRLGLLQAKAFILQLPGPDIVPEDLMGHFVRGVFDGDGTVGLNDGRWFWSIAGQDVFLQPLKEYLETKLFIKLGVSGNTLQASNKHAFEQLYTFMYNNATHLLERKKMKADDVLRHLVSVRGCVTGPARPAAA